MTGRGEVSRHVMTARVCCKKTKQKTPLTVDESSRSPWTSENPLLRSCRIPNGGTYIPIPPKCPFPCNCRPLTGTSRLFDTGLGIDPTTDRHQSLIPPRRRHRPQAIYDRRRVRSRYTELALFRNIPLAHSPLAGHGCDQEEGCQPRPSGARCTIPLRRL